MGLLSKANTKTFHRKLYAGWLMDITLLKRGNDQNQGMVTAHILFQCRRKKIFHSGEAIEESMAAQDVTIFQIPNIELQRVGVNEINALDRIVDEDNFTWQPEGDTTIVYQLGGNFLNIDCRRVE